MQLLINDHYCLQRDQVGLIQEGLAVASIARDDPSPLPGMHRDHNAPACTASCSAAGALWAASLRQQCALNLDRNLKPKFSYNAPMHFRHRQTDGQTDGH